MSNSKRLIALVSAMAMLVPVASTVELPQLSSVSVSAEDDTTTTEYSTDTELVNGEVPTPAEDFVFDATTGTITDYTGSESEIVIPRTIGGVPVRTLGVYKYTASFTTCDQSVTKITVPNNVITIGDVQITTLNEMVFEEGSKVTTISPYAFKGTAISKITLPDSIKTIGNEAFYGCTNLTEIKIPDDVSILDEKTFYNCKALRKVTIGDGVVSIGDHTFANCIALSEIDFNNVTAIDERAFYGCSGLTYANFPNVKSIGFAAFEDCKALSNVTFSDNLVSIDGWAFINNGIKDLVIPDSVTSIGKYAFGYRDAGDTTGVSSLVLPADIDLGKGAFSGTKIKTLTLKDNTTVGEEAFTECVNLVDINTEGSVNIGYHAFLGCSTLAYAVLSKETIISTDSNAIAFVTDGLLSGLLSPGKTSSTIYGYKGTNAESYAKAHSINFVDLEAEDDDTATIGESDTTVSADKGDVNGDGEVNGLDLLRLKKYILGLIDSL